MTSEVLSKPRFKVAIGRANAFTLPYSVPPIPVRDIVEQNGLRIEFTPFPGYEEEISGFCDFGSRKLYVNQNDPINKQTFTIAHEFGHWTMHKEFYIKHPEKYQFFPRFKSPDKSNPFEQEANFFAANLLAPSIF